MFLSPKFIFRTFESKINHLNPSKFIERKLSRAFQLHLFSVKNNKNEKGKIKPYFLTLNIFFSFYSKHKDNTNSNDLHASDFIGLKYWFFLYKIYFSVMTNWWRDFNFARRIKYQRFPISNLSSRRNPLGSWPRPASCVYIWWEISSSLTENWRSIGDYVFWGRLQSKFWPLWRRLPRSRSSSSLQSGSVLSFSFSNRSLVVQECGWSRDFPKPFWLNFSLS